MKRLLQLLLLTLTIQAYGQNITENHCNVIQFRHKDYLDSILNITPQYHPRGFYLLTNGVYDFVIDGKKYFQSILLKVDKDKFYISNNWESTSDQEKITDTLMFSINKEIQIRMVSINNGVGGLPFKTKAQDYQISIVPNDKYCRLKNVKITSKNQTYIGHFYFTAIGLKEIKIVKGKPYLVEERGEYIMRRN